MSTEPPRSERPDYDQALKPIISRAPAGFLGVIAPGIQWRGELSPELPAVTRQADLVWEVDFTDATHGILHVELQTQPDMQMGERMADYCTRLWMREHQPIYSVVVFLRPATTLPQSPFVIRCMGQERLRFTFDVVRIWELAPTLVLDTPYYDLWPLAGLMQDVTLDSTVAVASQIASSPVTRHEQSELIGLLALLSGMRLPRQVLMEALRRQHMIQDLLSESSFAGAVYDLARLEGMSRLIRITLEARFGSLSDDVRAAIDTAPEATLEAVATGLASEPLDQIRARLGLS